TSALDNETEALVMANLRENAADLTVLMVAHRLSTLAICDRLVRLADGQVAEIGTYDQLVGSSAQKSRGQA
ncbi:MAG: ABC transporter, partial [Allosphingosinicella sp.]